MRCLILLLPFLGTTSFVVADEPQFLPPVDRSFISKVDGSDQKYVMLRPRRLPSGKPCDIVIALHGHGSDRWQFIRADRPECAEMRRCAVAAGVLFVSPDYRGKTSWMSPAAEQDLLQLIQILKTEFHARRVIVGGGSMGGTAALAFAALHPEQVAGVVSLNGTANLVEYTGFGEAIAAAYGGTREQKPEVYRSRSAELNAAGLVKMPLAATTGGLDTVVPPHSVHRLIEDLQRQGAQPLLIHREQGGHSTNAEDTRDAVNFVLRQALTGRADR